MDLSDARRSLTAYIDTITPGVFGKSVDIIVGAQSGKIDRPTVAVEALPGGSTQRVNQGFTKVYQPFLVICATDFDLKGYEQAEKFISTFQQLLENCRWYMPGLLTDFRYPQPSLRAVQTTGGSLSPGTYYASVTGIDPVEENDTLLSVVQEIEVESPNNAIRMVIPTYPSGFSWFIGYKVWVGTTEDELRLQSPDAQPYVGQSIVGGRYYSERKLPTVFFLESYDNAGDVFPENDNHTIRYRLLDVEEESFRTGIYRDPSVESGMWLAQINMTICYPLSHRDNKPDIPIRNINVDVGAYVSVGVTD